MASGWVAPPQWMYHRCPGVTVYRYPALSVGGGEEKLVLVCLRHDQQGNHLVRDPDTGGERWCPR